MGGSPSIPKMGWVKTIEPQQYHEINIKMKSLNDHIPAIYLPVSLFVCFILTRSVFWFHDDLSGASKAPIIPVFPDSLKILPV